MPKRQRLPASTLRGVLASLSDGRSRSIKSEGPMPFEMAMTLSFATPVLVALLMPGFRSLAICTALLAAAIWAGLQGFEASINENNDGPGSAFVAMLFFL